MSAFAESRLESNIAAKIGGVLYVVWGALHLIAAWGIHVLAASVPSGLTYGRLEQADGTWQYLPCSLWFSESH